METVSVTESVLFPLKQEKWGSQVWKDNTISRFDRITISKSFENPIWSINYLQKGEKACSLLLQMKHSGETLLYRFQIMSLDSNTNETGRVLVSIPQQVRNGHSTAGPFQRLDSTRQHRRLTSVSAVKRWIVLKMVFSFLNFWSAKLALVCWRVEEWPSHTHYSW